MPIDLLSIPFINSMTHLYYADETPPVGATTQAENGASTTCD